MYCPRGSTTPISVQEGFYCDLSGENQGSERLFSEGDAVVEFETFYFLI